VQKLTCISEVEELLCTSTCLRYPPGANVLG
jgi:hypothetical protein